MGRGGTPDSVLDQQVVAVLGSREPQDSSRHSDRPPGASSAKSGRPLLRPLHRLTPCRRWVAFSSRRHAQPAQRAAHWARGPGLAQRAAGRVHLEHLSAFFATVRRKRRGAATTVLAGAPRWAVASGGDRHAPYRQPTRGVEVRRAARPRSGCTATGAASPSSDPKRPRPACRAPHTRDGRATVDAD